MIASRSSTAELPPAEMFINRELSWLAFARRVLSLVESRELPIAERLKFAGIVGMLHDEFFMKRVSGLKRQVRRGSSKLSIDGRTPAEELAACREELLTQRRTLDAVVRDDLLPRLAELGTPIVDHEDLGDADRQVLRDYFRECVGPILTPLAVDPEHPFPFISNLGLNLAVLFPDARRRRDRFVRVKVPGNRPRWVPLPKGGYVPIEQVIAANLDLMLPDPPPRETHLFRVTRGVEGEPGADALLDDDAPLDQPGSLVRQVSGELKARRFAGPVRLQVDDSMPKKLVKWLGRQIGVDKEDLYPVGGFQAAKDLSDIGLPQRPELRLAAHAPRVHPRLRGLPPREPSAIFEEIARGDILLHHPYHSFDDSVLRFLQSAASDPDVLAIKLTIYRTSQDSPIVKALTDAVRGGKQVAVLVEITARFDEAPNIAWGQFLEQEGVHVSYGVEKLKTHVKLALVVRDEREGLRRYVHVGTGNYHTGTARIYEDLGILTSDREICEETASVFNALTGATPHGDYRRLIAAPRAMRSSFVDMIRREADNATAGKPSGIRAKMNQLQDPQIIRELYAASQAGVPISLNVRGLCCLRPGVPGLSETIRVFGVVGRFLEHSRVYVFHNDGAPEYYIGSADWMKRNLDNRVETMVPALDPAVRKQLDAILDTYDADNASAWDCGPDGLYVRRAPGEGEERLAVQEQLLARHPIDAAEGEANAEEKPRRKANKAI